jgi:tRNA(Ile)-lysidine synthase
VATDSDTISLVIKAVSRFISERHLLRPGDRVGVAVSGGADSVALVRVLLEMRAELGVVLAVVHFNHRIRGAESDADEQFVRELAKKFALPFLSGAADVPAFAREHRLGLEAAARKLRYEYFATLLGAGPDAEKHETRVAQPSSAVAVEPARGPQRARFSRAGVRASRPLSRGHLPHAALARMQGLHPGTELTGASPEFPLDKIATAHTENDQAETVLMRLLRGAGTRGLGGIHPSLERARIVRPLLAVTRREVTAYLESIQQPWREDSSNRHLEHTRNRVRHELLPLLERDFNPAIVHVLAEHAEIAQAEEEYWNLQSQSAVLGLSHHERKALRVDWLLELPLALQRHVIRAAAGRAELTLDFKHIEAVRHLVASEIGLKPHYAALPGGEAEVALRSGIRELTLRGATLNNKESRRGGGLDQNKSAKKPAANNYEYRLAVPGSVEVREIGSQIWARLVSVEHMQSLANKRKVALQEEGKTAFQRYNQPKLSEAGQLLDPRCVGAELTVRNWRPGDRFWPARTKAPRKVKELLQKVAEAERKSWPVILSGNEIVWMRGFPLPVGISLPADAPYQTLGLLVEEKQAVADD